MLRWTLPLILAASVLLTACDPPDTELVDETHIAITNVNVLPMTQDTVLTDHKVVFRDGFITELAPVEDLEVRDYTEVIDGAGGYLIPGLAEMHAHLPREDDPEGIVDDVLTLFAAKGVTYARGMLGHPSHLELRADVDAGDRFGPALRVGSPFLSGNDLETPEDARERVREYADEGYDFLKMGEGLSREVYDAVVEEAQAQGLAFGGHVPTAVGLEYAMESGQETIDHLDHFIESMRGPDAPDDYSAIFGASEVLEDLDLNRMDDLIALAVETNTGQVPTMLVWERFFGDTAPDAYPDELPEQRYLPASMVDGWVESLSNIRERHTEEQGAEVRALRNDILRALNDAGAPILLGSDAPQMFNVPGFSIHDEMQFMQDEIGMTPYEVLYSGTGALAAFYGDDYGAGTVEVGQRADLLLLENNPLDDVAHAEDIAGVVLRGAWYPAEDLVERIAAIEARYERD